MAFKFYDLIPYLFSEKGHDHIYHRCLQNSIEQLGFQYIGLANKRALIERLPKNWFKCLPWKNEKRLLKKFSQLLVRTCIFAKLFKKNREKKCFFFEPMCRIDYLALLAAFFLFFRKSDLFLLFLRFEPQGSFYKLAIALMKAKGKDRLVFLTDSSQIEKHVIFSFHKKCHLVPIPHTFEVSSFLDEKKFNLILWWPGEPRAEKGKEEVVKMCQKMDPASSFFQLHVSESARSFIQGNRFSIHFLSEALNQEAYKKQMFRSDVILLPYDPASYRARTSGIFVEVIATGKLPLVKEGSWLAKELKKYDLFELIVDWENPLLLSQIYSLYHDEKVRKKLKRMQADYRKFHNPESFMQALQSLLCKEGVIHAS